MAEAGWIDTLPNGQPVVQGVSMVIIWCWCWPFWPTGS